MSSDTLVEPRTVTVDDVLSWEPCYTEERVRKLLAGKERWTALDFLDLDIPASDRFWVVLREELLDRRTLRLFACRCVRETPLGDGRTVWDLLTDARSRSAVETAERYANGEATATELDAAWAAAEAATRAARAAAEAATRAARAAAGDAAGAAAGAAAGDAAWTGAGDAQINILRSMLTEGGAA